MKPIGECVLGVEFKGTRHTLTVKVVQNVCKPLLWVETGEKLQLVKTNTNVTACMRQVKELSL